MQVKKQTIAKKVLLELAKHLNVKGIHGVAEFLGEDKNKLYAWSKRGKIADTGAILGKCPEIRKDWLETAEGPMLKPTYRIIEPDIQARVDKKRGVKETVDSPPQIVRDTAADMLNWLADNKPAEFYELLRLLRAAHNRCRDGK